MIFRIFTYIFLLKSFKFFSYLTISPSFLLFSLAICNRVIQFISLFSEVCAFKVISDFSKIGEKKEKEQINFS